MKRTLTIILDDESETVELVDFDGKVNILTRASLTVKREPVADREAERKSGLGYRIWKPGPVMEINLTGTVA